jgi:hypothetical protein
VNTARALRRLPPLDALPRVIERSKVIRNGATITSHIYHDHAANVRMAQACQRIGRADTGRDGTGPARRTS